MTVTAFGLALDADGDLAISEDGRRVLPLSGAALAAQQIRVGVRIWRGAYPYDPAVGLPALEQIYIKAPDLDLISQIFRRFLGNIAAVTSVDSVTCRLDRPARSLIVNFRVTCENGEALSDEIAFPLE